MNVELKRIALDFKWSEGKVWDGYVNPYYSKKRECHTCNGDGLSTEARKLKGQWYGNEAFKPEDRGSTPFLPTHPAILHLAERNLTHAPGFYGVGAAAIASNNY